MQELLKKCVTHNQHVPKQYSIRLCRLGRFESPIHDSYVKLVHSKNYNYLHTTVGSVS